MLNDFSGVVAGLVPAIHVFACSATARKTWMAATSAGMTAERAIRAPRHSGGGPMV